MARRVAERRSLRSPAGRAADVRSDSRIEPSGPEPVTVARSIESSLAIFLTFGMALPFNASSLRFTTNQL